MLSNWLRTSIILVVVNITASEDFYKLLNLSKDATTRELRRAFKKAALEYHPDKNQDNSEAHDKFILINRAYETLRDPDKRKQYDLYGEESANAGGQHQKYESWSYYHDNFGIYDDDPEIITLDKAEFEEAVRQSQDTWFINFYSPGCGHCHTLAPVWRRLARELQYVVRIGAVNCAEEWQLCRGQRVHAYPELIIYPEGSRYEGERTLARLVRHVLRRLHAAPIDVDAANVEHLTQRSSVLSTRPWLLFLCSADDDNCASEDTRVKLAAIMEGVLSVGQVDCSESSLCETLGRSQYPVYFDAGGVSAGKGRPVRHLDAQEIATALMNMLPPLPTMTESEYEAMRSQLEFSSADIRRLPWLVEFVSDLSTSLETIRLPSLLSMTSLSRICCAHLPHVCSDLHVHKHPSFVLFKPGGGYEVYHGRATAHDVATFVREAAMARLRTLTARDFPAVTTDGGARIVDFYAPWCPPCMKLLPELRKASVQQSDVEFGSVDCTAHVELCSRYNIRSYPTLLLYNDSQWHQYRGVHSAAGILQFVNDLLHPAVLTLDSAESLALARDRPPHQTWLIDYYADWCGPCQQFAPEYRRAARLLRTLPEFVVAMVDCAQQQAFCRQQGVRSYPTVRLYPAGAKGLGRYSVYSGDRDAESVRAWAADHLPDKVTVLTAHNFLPVVLDGDGPWLVDFYAPWCSHCQLFEPLFKLIGKTLDGVVRCGKLDCQRYPSTCRDVGVSAYPTVRLYRGGGRLDMVGTEVNSQDPDNIVAFVRERLQQWEVSGGKTDAGAAERQKDEL